MYWISEVRACRGLLLRFPGAMTLLLHAGLIQSRDTRPSRPWPKGSIFRIPAPPTRGARPGRDVHHQPTWASRRTLPLQKHHGVNDRDPSRPLRQLEALAQWPDGAPLCAAGALEAKKRIRPVNAHLRLNALRTAFEQHLAAGITPVRHGTNEEVAASPNTGGRHRNSTAVWTSYVACRGLLTLVRPTATAVRTTATAVRTTATVVRTTAQPPWVCELCDLARLDSARRASKIPVRRWGGPWAGDRST